jgi:hypothetical protein
VVAEADSTRMDGGTDPRSYLQVPWSLFSLHLLREDPFPLLLPGVVSRLLWVSLVWASWSGQEHGGLGQALES